MTKESYDGKSIKTLRKELKWTQSDLARYLGIDDSLVSRIENDRREPTEEQIERLQKLVFIVKKAIETHSSLKKKDEQKPIRHELLSLQKEKLLKLQQFHSQKVTKLKGLYSLNIYLTLLASTFFLVSLSSGKSFIPSVFSAVFCVILISISTYAILNNSLYKLKKHLKQLTDISFTLRDYKQVLEDSYKAEKWGKKAQSIIQESHELTFLSKKDREAIS